ncbi:hypothetical protein ABVK25_011970 [Lepraria finkii]|uniref:Uncharacterized protein n=1 Tax=Lepraria finkii TaxID=1340010 RepID=A0ABR4AJB5_9LECA
MSVPFGITVPKLLPITGTFAPAFAIYYVVLCSRVSMARVDSEKWLGDKSTSDPTASTATDPLYVASRCHQNFGRECATRTAHGCYRRNERRNRKALTAGLTTLIIARILHVELGLRERRIARARRHWERVGSSDISRRWVS